MSRFGFSMEDLQEEEVIEEVPAEEVPAEEVPAEPVDGEAFAEIPDEEIQQGDSTDVIEDAIGEVEDVAAGLEAIKERMIESLANGGLTKESAMWAQLSIDATCGKWIKPEKTRPALEGLNEEEGRMQATGYAIEGIADTIAAAWTKISDFVKRWLQSCDNLWIRLLTGVKGLKAEAAKLEANAKAHSGKMKEKTVSVSEPVYRNMTYDGHVSDKIAEALDKTAKLLSELTAESGAAGIGLAVSEALGKLDLFNAAKTDESFEALKSNEIITLPGAVKHFQSVSKIKWKEAKADDRTYMLLIDEPIIGGKLVLATLKGDKQGFFTGITVKMYDPRAFFSFMGKFANGAAMFAIGSLDKNFPVFNTDIEALEAPEVAKLAAAIGATADAIIDAKSNYKQRGVTITKINNLNATLTKKLKSVKSEGAALQWLKTYINGTAQLSLAVMQPDLDLQRQAYNSARSAFTYAVKCYKNLGGKAEEPAKEDEASAE